MTQPTHADSDVRTTTLSIAGMTCGACVRHVARALEGMSGVVHVEVDRRTNQATVEHLPQVVDVVALIAAIRDAGYAARVTEAVADPDGDQRSGPRPKRGCCCGETPGKDTCADTGTSTIG